LQAHFNIILPSIPGSSKLSPSLMLPHQSTVRNSPLPVHDVYPMHLILLDLIIHNSW
jgi:hypothetical protein